MLTGAELKRFFTGVSTERDPAGNLVIELRAVIGILLFGLAPYPVVVAAGYLLAGAPLGVSSAIVGAFLVLIGLDALGIALLIRHRSKSRVRVTIDRATSRVLVDTQDGQTAISIREIEKAELGSATVATSKGPMTRYRLEFVLRNRERMPATAGYLSVSPGDRENLLEALNHELAGRSVMLS